MSLGDLQRQLKAKESVKPQLNPYLLYFLLLLFTVFLIRVQTNVEKPNVTFNEAVNVTRGLDVLHGNTDRSANLLETGSYLFPVVAAGVNEIAGNEGIVGLAAVLGTLTALFIFLAAQVLFGTPSALFAMVLFGLLGMSINLGQVSLHQSLAMPLLALAFYLIVDSAAVQNRAGQVRVVGAGIAIMLAIFTAYVTALYLPLLFIVLILIHYSQGWQVHNVLSLFVMTITMITGAYLLLNYQLLSEFIRLEIEPAVQLSAARDVILGDLYTEMAFIVVPGLVGAVLFVVQLRWMHRMSNLAFLMTALFSPVMLVLAFAVPLYHVLVGSTQDLWQNSALTLIFIAPFAGFILSVLHDMMLHSRYSLQLRVVSFFVVLVIGWAYVNFSLDRNFGFIKSLPDLTPAISYVRANQPTPGTRILAEQAAIYEYYYDLGTDDADVWTDTFFMQYKGQEGVEAMVLAIHDLYFDYVILDDYFTANTVNPALEAALIEAGYRRVLVEPRPQVLSTDQEVLVRVYAVPER